MSALGTPEGVRGIGTISPGSGRHLLLHIKPIGDTAAKNNCLPRFCGGGRGSVGWSCCSHSGSPMKGSKGWHISHGFPHTSSPWQRWLEDGTLSLQWKHTVSMGSSGFSGDSWTPRVGVHSTRQKGQSSLSLFFNFKFYFFPIIYSRYALSHLHPSPPPLQSP